MSVIPIDGIGNMALLPIGFISPTPVRFGSLVYIIKTLVTFVTLVSLVLFFFYSPRNDFSHRGDVGLPGESVRLCLKCGLLRAKNALAMT